MVSKLKQSLQTFISHVNDLAEKDSDEEDGFTKEFQILRDDAISAKQCNLYPAEEGKLDINIRKNRYKDILPYDETRVVLENDDNEPGADYINANFIKDVVGNNGYIAAQGPLPHTVDHFWDMLWQYNIEVIVMVCREVEKAKSKCERYWSKKSEEKTFGDITVTLVEITSVNTHYCIRRLRATKHGEERIISQFHYTGWLDHDIPVDYSHIIDLITNMRESQNDTEHPIVVHCSAGCGRTGTICAVDYAWSKLRIGDMDTDFSMFDVIQEMRTQRPSMVQTPDQYRVAHLAVAHFFQEHLKMMSRHDYENVELVTLKVGISTGKKEESPPTKEREPRVAQPQNYENHVIMDQVEEDNATCPKTKDQRQVKRAIAMFNSTKPAPPKKPTSKSAKRRDSSLAEEKFGPEFDKLAEFDSDNGAVKNGRKLSTGSPKEDGKLGSVGAVKSSPKEDKKLSSVGAIKGSPKEDRKFSGVGAIKNSPKEERKFNLGVENVDGKPGCDVKKFWEKVSSDGDSKISGKNDGVFKKDVPLGNRDKSPKKFDVKVSKSNENARKLSVGEMAEKPVARKRIKSQPDILAVKSGNRSSGSDSDKAGELSIKYLDNKNQPRKASCPVLTQTEKLKMNNANRDDINLKSGKVSKLITKLDTSGKIVDDNVSPKANKTPPILTKKPDWALTTGGKNNSGITPSGPTWPVTAKNRPKIDIDTKDIQNSTNTSVYSEVKLPKDRTNDDVKETIAFQGVKKPQPVRSNDYDEVEITDNSPSTNSQFKITQEKNTSAKPASEAVYTVVTKKVGKFSIAEPGPATGPIENYNRIDFKETSKRGESYTDHILPPEVPSQHKYHLIYATPTVTEESHSGGSDTYSTPHDVAAMQDPYDIQYSYADEGVDCYSPVYANKNKSPETAPPTKKKESLTTDWYDQSPIGPKDSPPSWDVQATKKTRDNENEGTDNCRSGAFSRLGIKMKNVMNVLPHRKGEPTLDMNLNEKVMFRNHNVSTEEVKQQKPAGPRSIPSTWKQVFM